MTKTNIAVHTMNMAFATDETQNPIPITIKRDVVMVLHFKVKFHSLDEEFAQHIF